MEILETFNLSDEFDKLHSQYFASDFPLPEVKNIAAARTVRDGNGKIIASGFVKLLTEAIIVTDLKSSEISRVRALDLLVSDLIDWCLKHDVEQIHAFTSSKFGRVLHRRYGFKPIRSTSLVLDLS